MNLVFRDFGRFGKSSYQPTGSLGVARPAWTTTVKKVAHEKLLCLTVPSIALPAVLLVLYKGVGESCIDLSISKVRTAL